MSNVEQKLGMSLDDLINQQKTKHTARKHPAAPGRGAVLVQGRNTLPPPGRSAPTTVRVQGPSAPKVLPARQGRQQPQQQHYARTGRGGALGVSRGGVRKAGQPGRVLVVPRPVSQRGAARTRGIGRGGGRGGGMRQVSATGYNTRQSARPATGVLARSYAGAAAAPMFIDQGQPQQRAVTNAPGRAPLIAPVGSLSGRFDRLHSSGLRAGVPRR